MNDDLRKQIIEHPGTTVQIAEQLGVKEWVVREARALERMRLQIKRGVK
jgi:hypothetical protein